MWFERVRISWDMNISRVTSLLGLLANSMFLLASGFFLTLKEGIDSGQTVPSCWLGSGFRPSQPSEEVWVGFFVVTSSLVMVLVLYSCGAKWERQNSSLTARTTQIRVTMQKKPTTNKQQKNTKKIKQKNWGWMLNSCELWGVFSATG